MFTGDEASRFVPQGKSDPQTDVVLAWELLYRLEPELYDRLAGAERLHPGVVDWLPRDVDHRNLNTDVWWLKGRNPTTENLAQAFWERLEPELPDGLLRSVRVWETDKNWAEVGDRA